MGSYSSSVSTTAYTNTPLTLDNNENGVALAGNRDTQLGGVANIAGSTNSGNRSEVNTLTVNGGYTALDGGAIGRAFDFGNSAITLLANMTKQSNEQASISQGADVGFSNEPPPTQTIEGLKDNKYVWLGLGLAVVAFVIYKKGF